MRHADRFIAPVSPGRVSGGQGRLLDQLHQSYLATAYRVLGAEPAVDMRIDRPCPSLDRLLEQRGVAHWAFITAWNPMSIPLPLSCNRERAARLARDLAGKYESLPGLGIPDKAGWTPEESLLVLGIEENTAVELARRYGQRAIVAGERGGVPRLVKCA